MELVVVAEQALVDKSLCLQSVVHGLTRDSSFFCAGLNSHYSKMDFIVSLIGHLTTSDMNRNTNENLHIRSCLIVGKITKVFRINEIFEEKKRRTCYDILLSVR